MKLLTGRVEHQLDSKNRIRIPAKYKNAFPDGEKLYFFEYIRGRVAVMPESVLAEKLARLGDISPANESMMDSATYIYSIIDEVNEDSQGRTQIPKTFRDDAGLTKDIITVGMGSYIEIWAKENYEARIGTMTIQQANETLYRKNDGNS